MPNIDLKGRADISSFRQMAVVAWNHPFDPTIYGHMDFDAEKLEARIQQLKEQGIRVTVTHIVARALALAFGNHPDLNVTVRRRTIYNRKNVDVFLQVAIPDPSGLGKADLSGVKIRNCDEKDIVAIAAEVDKRVEQVRNRADPELQKSKNTIGKIPRFALKGVVRFMAWMQREPNFAMKWAGMPKDPFGSVMVSSLGMMGIDTAFAPLFPLGGPPAIFLVSAIKMNPVCTPDGQVVARRQLRLCGTFDHRVLDGYHLSVLAKELHRYLEDETEKL